MLTSPVKSTASIFDPTQTNLPPSFVAFSTKVKDVMIGRVTTTGVGLTVGVVDDPDPDEPDPVEPEPVEPEPEEIEPDEPDEPEPEGTEGAGADGTDGGAGTLKVSDADGVLAALVPIALVASTVNVYAVPATKPVITQLVAVVVVHV